MRSAYRALGDGWKLDSLFIGAQDSTVLLTQRNAAGALLNLSDYDYLITTTRDECVYFRGYESKSTVTNRMTTSLQTVARLGLRTSVGSSTDIATVWFNLFVETKDMTTNRTAIWTLEGARTLSNSVVNGKLYMYCSQPAKNNRSVWLVFSR